MDENRLDKKQIREIKDESRLDPKKTEYFYSKHGQKQIGRKNN